jgi:aspartate kinase
MMEKKTRIGGIMHNDRLGMIGVQMIPAQPGVGGRILSALGQQNINVLFIVQTCDQQGYDYFVLCIANEDFTNARIIVDGLREELKAQSVTSTPNVGLVSIFGPDFRQRPGVAGEMFAALGEKKINIKAISTSISTISCIIDRESVAAAVNALEMIFEIP